MALRFLQFAQGHEQLYILGDLFEYWLGDDAGVPLYKTVIQALNQLADSGCRVTVMLGNRDFLLGKDFEEASGTNLTTHDELIIYLNDSPVLLMHGDTLCTDDTDYQQFRSLVRQSQWQSDFQKLTIDERVAQAQAMRAASKDASAAKQSHIMDVNSTAVAQRIESTGCQTLIHGHTHRPAKHNLPLHSATRWVVGDWHSDHARYVLWDGNGFQLKTFT